MHDRLLQKLYIFITLIVFPVIIIVIMSYYRCVTNKFTLPVRKYNKAKDNSQLVVNEVTIIIIYHVLER